jgi:hypothetical protein
MAELTDKQREAIPKILGGKTIGEGCKDAKISQSTFYVWKKNPEFVEEFDYQRNELIKAAYSVIEGSLEEAALKLRELLKSKDVRVQRMAAVNIIELYGKHVESGELKKKVEEIEKKLDKLLSKGGRNGN